MRSSQMNPSLKGPHNNSRPYNRPVHSSSRWERDLQKFRSESLGSSSCVTKRPNSLSKTGSFEVFSQSADHSSSQMSSIFEPETEAGLYDDDESTAVEAGSSNVTGQPREPTNPFSASTAPEMRINDACDYVASGNQQQQSPNGTNTWTGPRRGSGLGVNHCVGGTVAPPGVICIELEPPTPTTDEDAGFDRGVISFQSPPESPAPLPAASSPPPLPPHHPGQKRQSATSSSSIDAELPCNSDTTDPNNVLRSSSSSTSEFPTSADGGDVRRNSSPPPLPPPAASIPLQQANIHPIKADDHVEIGDSKSEGLADDDGNRSCSSTKVDVDHSSRHN